MILKVQHISKKYGTQQVLNDISFDVKKGEIIGFLGPNGAGKTTTMKIITNYLSSDEGTILVEGVDTVKDELETKSIIGYLPENNPLYEDMYVIEYLEYVSQLHSSVKHTKENVQTAIKQVGLNTEAHKRISELSKGYKQRVGLAQAIIHDPKLLILDEPTSGLDPNQIDEINHLLLDLSKDKAILFSSHTLSEVVSICTRIIIIHRGNIVLDKPIAEIENVETMFKTLTKN